MTQKSKPKRRTRIRAGRTSPAKPVRGPSALPALLIPAVFVVLAVIARIHLLNVPLERDEGEYAYAGRMILGGYPPYVFVYNMKLPGIYAVYAVILFLLGKTAGAVHLGLLVANLATMVGLFFLGRRIKGSLTGVLAASVFGILTLDASMLGFSANAEQFVLLPAVFGLLLVLRAREEDRLLDALAGGLLLGLAFLVKQHGALFAGAAGVYLVLGLRPPTGRGRAVQRLALFVGGATIPYAATCLVYVALGHFDAFWFWTVTYARAYTEQIPLASAWSSFTASALPILRSMPTVWTLVVLGTYFMLRQPALRGRRDFLSLLAVASALAVCPGFLFRPHYFLLLAPAAALLAAVGATSLADRVSVGSPSGRRLAASGIVAAVLLVPVIQHRNYLFVETPTQVSRRIYGGNPFVESPEIARFIASRTGPDDTVLILGSEPQILFYADRRSATGYVYTYALMEEHDYALHMQEELIQEAERARPKILVYVQIGTSWLRRPGSPARIFEWSQTYTQDYDLVGYVEMYSDRPVYHWDRDLSWPPKSRTWIGVWQRHAGEE